MTGTSAGGQRSVSRPAEVWVRRLLLAAAAAGTAYGVTAVADLDPNPVPLLAIVAGSVLIGSVVADVHGETGASWDVAADSSEGPPVEDPGATNWARVIDSHLTSRTPDAALRDRLRRVAGDRLARHHGLAVADPEAALLLGPAVVAVLDGPVRRLKPAEIELCVDRVEAL